MLVAIMRLERQTSINGNDADTNGDGRRRSTFWALDGDTPSANEAQSLNEA